MSHPFDQSYWDDRYGALDDVWSGRPNPVLVNETRALTAGRAMDIGCGEGADSIWLASRGWIVTGVDFSAVALERAAARSRQATGDLSGSASWATRLSWEQHDLTEWAPPVAAFDLVSAQFMHLPSVQRIPLFRSLAAAVAPHGTLLIVGHDITHAHGTDRAHNPDLFFTAEEVADSLGTALDRSEWVVDVAESRPRAATGPTGVTISLRDAVLSARRR